MKLTLDTFERVKNVIQTDKAVVSDGCKALVLKDVATKLNEYFELKSTPEMEVVYEDGIYRVELKFDALRVKKFNVLR
ncbi:MAG: hypothetical protein E7343_03725 [Clostridiales bacterium]|nr:hypothetical protein [Clostridiales bacterium]